MDAVRILCFVVKCWNGAKKWGKAEICAVYEHCMVEGVKWVEMLYVFFLFEACSSFSTVYKHITYVRWSLFNVRIIKWLFLVPSHNYCLDLTWERLLWATNWGVLKFNTQVLPLNYSECAPFFGFFLCHWWWRRRRHWCSWICSEYRIPK